MEWMTAPEAAQYCGDISEKVLYAAARDRKLRVAYIGAGRNWVDEWLRPSVEQRSGDEVSRG